MPRHAVWASLAACVVSAPAHATCALSPPSVSAFVGQATLTVQQVAGITVSCDSEYRLGLDAGAQPSGLRRLSNGAGQFIAYRLWQDAGASQEWGDSGFPFVTTVAAPALSATGGGNSITHRLFASGADVGALPGLYSDTLRVILAYPPYGPNDQQTLDFTLSWQVPGSCRINAGGVGNFGTWPAGSRDLSGVALGALSVECSAGVRYGIGMDAGQHFDNGQRRMSDGEHFVPYVLYADQSGTEWGDSGLDSIESSYQATHPAPTLWRDSSGSPQALFVWGDAAVSAAPAGIYQDTVTITVVW